MGRFSCTTAMKKTDRGFTAPGHKASQFQSTVSAPCTLVLLHHNDEKDCPWFYSTGTRHCGSSVLRRSSLCRFFCTTTMKNTDHGFTAPGHRALWFLSTASAQFSCTTTTKKTDCGFSVPGHKVLWLLSTVSLFSGLVLLHHDDEKY
jgi:hypothetical protein